MDEYTYSALEDSKAVRVLTLHASENREAPIECALSIREDTDHYDALSYVWGSRMSPNPVKILDGSKFYSFQIGLNLESALRGLREPFKKKMLWIDAICINQADKNEKSEQLAMMAAIYGKADSVCVWLGEEEGDSSTAIQFIHRVLHIQDFDHCVRDKKASYQWKALSDLMRRPWFSRRWVVQEIASASSATLHCGNDRVTWQDFADAVKLFEEFETRTRDLSRILMSQEEFGHIPNFFGELRALGACRLVDATSRVFHEKQNGQREKQLSLEYLIADLSPFEATNPRDIICAVLPIAKDVITSTEAIEAEVQSHDPALPMAQRFVRILRNSRARKIYHVHYDKGVFEVYRDFVEFTIKSSQSLDVLCRPWAPALSRDLIDKEGPLPSWIATLTGAAFWKMPDSTSQSRFKMTRKNADCLVGLPDSGRQTYNAAGGTRVDYKFHDRSVSVKGFVLDTVGSVGSGAQLGNIPWKWLRIGGWTVTQNANGGADAGFPPGPLWRTLVADCNREGEKAPAYYARMLQYAISQSPYGDTIELQKFISHQRCSVVSYFCERVQAVIYNRRLIVSSTSQSLGLVPEAAKGDDLICILYGCSAPVILRRVEDPSKQCACPASPEASAGRTRTSRKRAANASGLSDAKRQRVEVDGVQTRAQAASSHGTTSSLDTEASARSPTLEHGGRRSPVVQILRHAELIESPLNSPTTQRRDTDSAVETRCESHHHKLLGECYLHGMMNGEALSYRAVHDLPEQHFELR